MIHGIMEDPVCALCLTAVPAGTNTVTTRCGHTFHWANDDESDCLGLIQHVRGGGASCPMCRTTYGGQPTVPDERGDERGDWGGFIRVGPLRVRDDGEHLSAISAARVALRADLLEAREARAAAQREGAEAVARINAAREAARRAFDDDTRRIFAAEGDAARAEATRRAVSARMSSNAALVTLISGAASSGAASSGAASSGAASSGAASSGAASSGSASSGAASSGAASSGAASSGSASSGSASSGSASSGAAPSGSASSGAASSSAASSSAASSGAASSGALRVSTRRVVWGPAMTGAVMWGASMSPVRRSHHTTDIDDDETFWSSRFESSEADLERDNDE